MRTRLIAGGFALQIVVPLAAATGLTLNNNFQLLPVPAPAACALAYSTTIPNCVVADFQSPNMCSDACVAGLQSIAAGVNADCVGLDAGDLTLISKVLNGLIIPSVCPRNTVQPSSPSPPTKSTTSTHSATAATTSTLATSQATFQASSSAVVSSAGISAPTLSSAPPAVAATTSSQPASQKQSTSTTTTTSSSGSPTVANPNGSPKGLSMEQQQIAAGSDSRGGSPFDVIGYSGASKQQIAGIEWAMVVLFWTVIALGR